MYAVWYIFELILITYQSFIFVYLDDLRRIPCNGKSQIDTKTEHYISVFNVFSFFVYLIVILLLGFLLFKLKQYVQATVLLKNAKDRQRQIAKEKETAELIKTLLEAAAELKKYKEDITVVWALTYPKPKNKWK